VRVAEDGLVDELHDLDWRQPVLRLVTTLRPNGSGGPGTERVGQVRGAVTDRSLPSFPTSTRRASRAALDLQEKDSATLPARMPACMLPASWWRKRGLAVGHGCRYVSVVLSEILPGIRHVRTPLVVGGLWLLLVWLVAGRSWPDEGEATGLWPDIYKLADLVGQPVVVASLALAAYVVGARMQWLLTLLQDGMRRSVTPRLPRWWSRLIVPTGIPTDVKRVAQAMAARYPEPDSSDGGVGMRTSDFRAALDIAVSAARFAWPAEAPDLYHEFDRRESERDFSNGIVLPLGALGLALFVIAPTWAWLAVAFVGLALLSKQAANHQHRELERFVIEAVLTGRVKSAPLSELIGDWWDRAGVPLPFRRPMDAGAKEGSSV
jgi:hypothetical protein